MLCNIVGLYTVPTQVDKKENTVFQVRELDIPNLDDTHTRSTT